MAHTRGPLTVPQRVLLGPGPSDVAPSVLSALGKPTLGHLDPLVLRAMDELREMLRSLYRTANEWTFAVSGTGTAGMETALANLIQPGERVLVAVQGYFGARIAEIARRCGAEVVAVEGAWGRPADVEALRRAAQGRCALLCAVQAETSTGVLQDLRPLRQLADELGALLLVDAVTSKALDKGLEIAGRMIRHLKEEKICDGVHIMAIGKEGVIPDIIRAAGLNGSR